MPQTGGMQNTYEDQSGVQVFIISLDELSVVLLCFAAVHLVELRSVIFLCWRRALFVAAKLVSYLTIIQRRETQQTHPSAGYPVPPVRSQISSQDQDTGCSQTLGGSVALRHNKSYPNR